MNLIIDVGNTLLKLAVFDSDVLLHKKSCNKKEFLMTLSEISESYSQINHCIVSSVGDFTKQELSELEALYPTIVLTNQTKVPFSNLYETPKTLGVDRIALVSSAAVAYPERNVLIIDAGSCVTYDFLNNDNEYLGGAISPGLSMRYSALNNFTAKLPHLEADTPETLIGNSTAASIHSGVTQGLLYEIDGFIEDYKTNYTDLTIILTGGDTHFLRDSLKSDIFANSNFLLEGLNFILEHNKD